MRRCRGDTLPLCYLYSPIHFTDPTKANQDKYGITLNFAGEAGDAMFAVYDGHGAHGHEAASFAKKKLPQVLAKHIRQKRVQKYTSKLKGEGKTTKGAWNPKQWPILDTAELEACCQKSFVETNDAMHNEKSVRVNLFDEQTRKFGSEEAHTVGTLFCTYWFAYSSLTISCAARLP